MRFAGGAPRRTAQDHPDWPGLTQWLRDEYTLTPATDRITQWTDKSGVGNHVIASGLLRPTLVSPGLNGHPVPEFDGVRNVLAGSGLSSLIAANAWTVYVVAYSADATTGRGLMGSADWAIKQTSASAPDDLRARYTDNVSADQNIGLPSESGAAWKILVWTLQGGSHILDDGTTSRETDMVPPILQRTSSQEIGRVGSGLWQGLIAEVIVANVGHDFALRSATRAYLKRRYGL